MPTLSFPEGDIILVYMSKKKIQTEILIAIEDLTNEDYKTLLILRYLQDLKWIMLCAKLSIVKTTAMRWHREVLKEIHIPE